MKTVKEARDDMTIAPDVKCLLPEVLIHYLCDLIAAETASFDAALVACTLDIGEKGGKPVQSIGFLGSRHVVFGFTPVQCRLLVMISHGCCRMDLFDE